METQNPCLAYSTVHMECKGYRFQQRTREGSKEAELREWWPPPIGKCLYSRNGQPLGEGGILLVPLKFHYCYMVTHIVAKIAFH